VGPVVVKIRVSDERVCSLQVLMSVASHGTCALARHRPEGSCSCSLVDGTLHSTRDAFHCITVSRPSSTSPSAPKTPTPTCTHEQGLPRKEVEGHHWGVMRVLDHRVQAPLLQVPHGDDTCVRA
jgi:hypothetical protein